MRLAWIALLVACGGSNPSTPADAHINDTPIGNDTPAPASVLVSPMMGDFGTVSAGTHSAALRFTISNPGGSATSSLTVSIGGEFTIDATTCTNTLAVGASCTADVAATPLTQGSKTGALTASEGILVMSTAQLVAAATSNENGALFISPSSHAFGDLAVGQTSAATTFTVSNPGGITISGLMVVPGGPDPTEFTVATNTCTTLAPGGTCTFGVAFSPTLAAASAAMFSISGSGSGTFAVSVTGTGTPAMTTSMIDVSPSSYDFGSVGLAQPPTTKTFTVTNGGTAAITLTTGLSGTNASSFAIAMDACAGVALSPQASCTLQVQFHSSSPTGPKTAQLDVGSAGGSAAVPLSGLAIIGPAQITANPASLDFGTIAVNTTANASFTITNNGATTTGALGVTITGIDATAFATGVDGCTGVQLANGQSCTIHIVFMPAATGMRQASATVSAVPGGIATVALSGMAVSFPIVFNPSVPHDFGSVVAGQTTSQTFTVTNVGSPPSGPLGVTLGGTDVAQFAIANDMCSSATLVSGGSCTFAVVFAPTTTGAKSASVSVTTSSLTLTAGLAGTGI